MTVCGANLTLGPEWSGNRSLAPQASGSGPSMSFAAPDVYWGSVRGAFSLDGLDRTSGNNVNCARVFFETFGLNSATDKCVVNLTTFDETVWEGTYEITLSSVHDSGTAEIDLKGSFRMPPTYTP
jgi:hypothetical protein